MTAPLEWSIDEVAEWMVTIGFPDYTVRSPSHTTNLFTLSHRVFSSSAASQTTHPIPLDLFTHDQRCFSDNFINGKKLETVNGSKLPKLGKHDLSYALVVEDIQYRTQSPPPPLPLTMRSRTPMVHLLQV
jgi:hypothetical protein